MNTKKLLYHPYCNRFWAQRLLQPLLQILYSYSTFKCLQNPKAPTTILAHQPQHHHHQSPSIVTFLPSSSLKHVKWDIQDWSWQCAQADWWKLSCLEAKNLLSSHRQESQQYCHWYGTPPCQQLHHCTPSTGKLAWLSQWGDSTNTPQMLWWTPSTYRECQWPYGDVASVGNWCGKPASGPGWDRENGSVQFQPCPKTRPSDSWRAKPWPRRINPRVLPGLATPVGSNLRFRVSGFTHMVAFRYDTIHREILTLLGHSSFSMYWPPKWSKPIDTHALEHPGNVCQRRVNDCCSCVLGNLEVQQVEYSHQQSIGCLYCQQSKRNTPYPILTMSVNRASTNLGLTALVIWVALHHKHP